MFSPQDLNSPRPHWPPLPPQPPQPPQHLQPPQLPQPPKNGAAMIPKCSYFKANGSKSMWKALYSIVPSKKPWETRAGGF